MAPRTKKQKETRRPSRYENRPTQSTSSTSTKSKITKPPQNQTKQRTKQLKKQQQKQTQQHNKPTIPFSALDNILLVGEGDFSFAASLVTHHGCTNVLATTLDSAAQSCEKYPHVSENVCRILGVDGNGDGGALGVAYGVDAVKLGACKVVKRKAPFDKIFFNFPHVGGKTTDVNRQVRANQEVLAGFFRAAKGLLRGESERGRGSEGEGRDIGGDGDGGSGSSILVTIFDGEPYSLWNVRDLARHVGLVVKRSFVFKAEGYPGYRHARTIGVVRKGGSASVVDGISETAWKGESRPARTFEFGLKVEDKSAAASRFATGANEVVAVGQRGRLNKRKKGDGGSDSESD